MGKRRLPSLQQREDAPNWEETWGDMHDARRLSGLGTSTIRGLAKDNKIRTAKVGKRRLFDIPFLLAYIASKATGPTAAELQPAVELDSQVGEVPAPVTPQKRRAGPRAKVVTFTKPKRKAKASAAEHRTE